MRLIDADALREKAYKEHIPGEDYLVVDWQDIEGSPTIDTVPVRYGEWLPDNRRPSYIVGICSQCGCEPLKSFAHPTYNFCPNCGADMRKQ